MVIFSVVTELGEMSIEFTDSWFSGVPMICDIFVYEYGVVF